MFVDRLVYLYWKVLMQIRREKFDCGVKGHNGGMKEVISQS